MKKLLVGAASISVLLSAMPVSAAENVSTVKSTSIIVATDRHETSDQSIENPLAKTNNLSNILALVKNSDAPQPAAVLLAGDNVGNPDFAFSISEIQDEITFALGDEVDISFSYGSHDKYCKEGYDAFLTGSKKMDGYYLYGISYSQMQYATQEEFQEAYDENVEKSRKQELDITDPNGVCATEASQKFIQWVDSLQDNRPIIVSSHVPLHYLRNDNLGGRIWTDALNYASESHDVIFIWGHNHTLEENMDKGSSMMSSYEDRDYYLAIPGDIIKIQNDDVLYMYDDEGNIVTDDRGNASKLYSGDDVEIQFTYMNAGYLKLGYCSEITFIDNESDGIYDHMSIQRFSLNLESNVTDMTDFGTTGHASPYNMNLNFATTVLPLKVEVSPSHVLPLEADASLSPISPETSDNNYKIFIYLIIFMCGNTILIANVRHARKVRNNM